MPFRTRSLSFQSLLHCKDFTTMKKYQVKANSLLRHSIRSKIDVPQIRCNREIMIVISIQQSCIRRICSQDRARHPRIHFLATVFLVNDCRDDRISTGFEVPGAKAQWWTHFSPQWQYSNPGNASSRVRKHQADSNTSQCLYLWQSCLVQLQNLPGWVQV